MPDDRIGHSTAEPWQLQVSWSEVVTETFTTFEAAHERAIELVRDHDGAAGVVHGGRGLVVVSASYYGRSESPIS